MIELFDKKFVHFMWDDELEGKKCFVKDCIDELVDVVEKGGADGSQEAERCVSDALQEVRYSGKPYSPFHIFSGGEHYDFVFCYYDPNYSIKKAFNEGKTIQYQPIDELNWRDVGDEESFEQYLEEGRVFRIKPEDEKWIAYLARSSMGTCYLTACREDRWEPVQKDYGAKTKLFVGSESEVEEWYTSRRKFAAVIKAWEDGKEIQFRVLDNWVPACSPRWDIDNEYRVKPEEEMNDKMNPIQGNKMRRYNLNLGDWDELKEMAVKMFKGIAALNEKFAEKISKGGFVTQDDWKKSNGLWQTFNYTNDDNQLCKDDLHHLFTDNLDEEFVEIKAEEVKDKKYRPYKSVNEFLQDFQERFGIKYNPSWSMPTIWLWDKELDRKCLVRDFESDKVMCGSTSWTMEELFDRWTYLDGSLVGMEVKE